MKKIIIIFSIFIFICILFLILIYHNQTVAVLGYHDFIKHEDRVKQKIQDNLVMDIENFEKQLKYLKKHHYKTLTLDEFFCYHNKTCKIPKKSVLITMDDGYMSNYELAFPLLKKYDMHAVVFYVGNNYDGHNKNYMNIDIIKKIKNEYPNIEVASHSYNLHEDGAIDRGINYIKEDFRKMHEIINTSYFAYPYGHYNDDIIEVLKDNNYKLAFTFGPEKNHRKAKISDDAYLISRLNISNDLPLWKFILRLKLPY